MLLYHFEFSQSGIYSMIGGGTNYQINRIVPDSISNKVFISGYFSKVNGNFNAKGMAVWNVNHWDSIHHLQGMDSISDFQMLDNDIYGLGYNLVKLNRITGNWDKIASFKHGWCTTLCKYQNKLFIGGNFDTINNIPYNFYNRALFDGVNFLPIGTNSITPLVTTAVEYQGKLYMGGNMADYIGDFEALAVWDGISWSQLGNKMNGIAFYVSKLIIYKNKLIIAGEFNKTNNAMGNTIFSYDGVNFDTLNGGMNSSYETITEMFEYKGKLIITGMHNNDNFFPNSSFICPAFISFDGNDFCAYTNYTNVGSGFNSGAVYNDTLIFSTPKKIGQDSVSHFAKYMGSFTPVNCVNVVGIKEISNQQNPISIFPNPTNSIINISDEFNQFQNSTIIIKNNLGQVVYTNPFTSQINLSHFSAGMYFLTIENKEYNKTIKIIKQ